MKPYVIKKIIDASDFDEIDPIEQIAFTEGPFPKVIYINDFLNHPYSEYYKLLIEDKIIGFIGIWVVYEDVQITTFAIDPKFQGQGYGSILLEYIIEELKNRLCQNITLEVRVSNEKAIKLYQKYSFYKVALRKRYYENGEDAFLMKLDL